MGTVAGGWDGGGWDWAPSGVLGDDVVNGHGSSGDQSWGNRLRASVLLARGDGDQSSLVLVDGGGVGSGNNGGDGSDSGGGRELHFWFS